MATVDPTHPQSWNRYAYVTDSPLSLIDPYGLYLDCSGQICQPFSYDVGLGCTMNVTYDWTQGDDGVWYQVPNFNLVCGGGGQVAGAASGVGGGGGAGKKGRSFANCVKGGADAFSLQSVLQGVSGGRLGNSWLSSAFLGNTVSSVITGGQWLASKFSPSPGAPSGGQAAGALTGEAVSYATGQGAPALAPQVPNVILTVAASTSTLMETPTSLSLTTLQATASATIPLNAAATGVSDALTVLGVVKLPWDLTAAGFSALVCSLNY
jgi:hypothetical protein